MVFKDWRSCQSLQIHRNVWPCNAQRHCKKINKYRRTISCCPDVFFTHDVDVIYGRPFRKQWHIWQLWLVSQSCKENPSFFWRHKDMFKKFYCDELQGNFINFLWACPILVKISGHKQEQLVWRKANTAYQHDCNCQAWWLKMMMICSPRQLLSLPEAPQYAKNSVR